MHPICEKTRWLVARGGVTVLFGLLVLMAGGATLAALSTLFGVFALAIGAFQALAGFERRPRLRQSWGFLAGAAFSVGAAIVAFAWPRGNEPAFLLLLATWLVGVGLADFLAGVRIRRDFPDDWLVSAAGAAGVGLGLLLAVAGPERPLAAVWLLGTYAIAAGVALAGDGLRLKRVVCPRERARRAGRPVRPKGSATAGPA